MYLSLAWQLKPRGRERESEVSTTSAAVLGWAQKQLIASTSLDWMLKGAKSTSRITCPVVGASPGWRRIGWTSGGRGTEHLVILSFLCVRIMLASPEIYCWRIYIKYIYMWHFADIRAALTVLGSLYGSLSCRLWTFNKLYLRGILYFHRNKILYKPNIVGMDAFLKMAVAIASLPYCTARSGWVFATVERIIRWNHFAGSQGLAAARRWRPRSKP